MCIYRALNTVYHMRVCPFFQRNATHQVKANAIDILEANPLAEIGWLLQCVHLHISFSYIVLHRYKKLSPNTHFYTAWVSIVHFAQSMGSLVYTSCFLVLNRPWRWYCRAHFEPLRGYIKTKYTNCFINYKYRVCTPVLIASFHPVYSLSFCS